MYNRDSALALFTNPPRSHSSTQSILGSHHMYFFFCRLSMTPSVSRNHLLQSCLQPRKTKHSGELWLCGRKCLRLSRAVQHTLKIRIVLLREVSAGLPACQIDFRLTKHARVSYFEAFRRRIARSIPIISRKLPLQEAQDMRVDLLELKQKAIVSIL